MMSRCAFALGFAFLALLHCSSSEDPPPAITPSSNQPVDGGGDSSLLPVANDASSQLEAAVDSPTAEALGPEVQTLTLIGATSSESTRIACDHAAITTWKGTPLTPQTAITSHIAGCQSIGSDGAAGPLTLTESVGAAGSLAVVESACADTEVAIGIAAMALTQGINGLHLICANRVAWAKGEMKADDARHAPFIGNVRTNRLAVCPSHFVLHAATIHMTSDDPNAPEKKRTLGIAAECIQVHLK